MSDMAGQILRRDETDNNASAGDPHELWYRYDGRQLGMVGNNGTLETDYAGSIANRVKTQGAGAFRFGAATSAHQAEFGPSLAPITSYAQGAAGGSYTVRAGDTLGTIAAGLWGDASLWYTLAEANGLGSDGALAEGQILMVPAGVLRAQHNASTFKPYDAADALGETSPLNPTPTGRKKNKCGAFGAILLTVVAVAVAAILAPPLIGHAATATASATGLTAVLGATGGAIAGGAIAGVAGSVASQAVGLATGIQDKFNWKQVALAGISGAVGGGLSAGKVLHGIGSPFLRGAATGALSNAATQGIAVVTGLQSKFDFAGVAVGGAVGGASAALGGALGAKGALSGLGRALGGYGTSLATSTAGALAGGAARSLITGNSFGDNVLRALPDVIGSTVGNALTGAVMGSRGGRANTAQSAEDAVQKSGSVGTSREVTAAELRARAEVRLYQSSLRGGNVQWRGGESFSYTVQDIRNSIAEAIADRAIVVTGSRLIRWSNDLGNYQSGLVWHDTTARITASINESGEGQRPTIFNGWPQAFGGGTGGAMERMSRGIPISVNGRGFNFSLRPPVGSWTPSGGSTSVLFLTDRTRPNIGLRLDYGHNGRTNSTNWHWNQRGVFADFRITDHSTGAGAARLGPAVTAARYGSRALVVTGMAVSAYEIGTSQHPVYETGRQASGWAGALAGGSAGAEGGAIVSAGIGVWFGGAGAAPGAAIGGVVGGLVGGGLGWFGGTTVYEYAAPAPTGYRRP